MNVVIINDYAHINGGAAAVAIESALGLANAGFQVYYISVVGPIDERLHTQKNLKVFCSEGFDILNDPRRWRAAINGYWNVSEGRRLELILRSLDSASTIIHIHGWMKAFSPAIFTWLRRSGFRVVVTLHDYFIACPNGAFLVYPKQENCTVRPLSWACLTCNCDSRSYSQKLWRFGRGIMQDRIFNYRSMVNGYIGVSEFSLQHVSTYLPSNVPRRVILNPVALPPDIGSGGNEQGPLLFVGRLSDEKAPLLAAEAARRLGHTIEFVGDGPLRARLANAYPEARCLGWHSRDQVLALMRKASILLFPSVWLETNGLVVVEAMSQGLPAVISDGIAASEFASDGLKGRTFRRGDVDDLVTQIRVVQSRWQQMSRAAHAWYWKNPWTIESHCAELLDWYRHILVGDLLADRPNDSLNIGRDGRPINLQ